MKNLKLNTRNRFIRLITLLVLECFIVSSIAQNYEEITAISRNDCSDPPTSAYANFGEISPNVKNDIKDLNIGSLSGSPSCARTTQGELFPEETALHQARLFLDPVPSENPRWLFTGVQVNPWFGVNQEAPDVSFSIFHRECALHRDSPSGAPHLNSLLSPFNPQAIVQTFKEDLNYPGNSSCLFLALRDRQKFLFLQQVVLKNSSGGFERILAKGYFFKSNLFKNTFISKTFNSIEDFYAGKPTFGIIISSNTLSDMLGCYFSFFKHYVEGIYFWVIGYSHISSYLKIKNGSESISESSTAEPRPPTTKQDSDTVSLISRLFDGSGKMVIEGINSHSYFNRIRNSFGVIIGVLWKFLSESKWLSPDTIKFAFPAKADSKNLLSSGSSLIILNLCRGLIS